MRWPPDVARRTLIHNLRAWEDWSPWQEETEGYAVEYSGPAEGVGARQSWSGRKSGKGTMEVTRTTTEQVVVQMEFPKPFRATNEVRFDLLPTADGRTDLRWTMSGEQGL